MWGIDTTSFITSEVLHVLEKVKQFTSKKSWHFDRFKLTIFSCIQPAPK